jgi:hypothetical protein
VSVGQVWGPSPARSYHLSLSRVFFGIREKLHVGNYHFSNDMGFSGKHPTANAAEFKKYAALGERFVRRYPSEFFNLTLHRTWWFWDDTSLLYQSREWWPWEFRPLSLAGWLGLLLVLMCRPRWWLLFSAALLVYPIAMSSIPRRV